MGVADSLILKLAENGLAFIMAALIIAGLLYAIKYIYTHLMKEVEHWRGKYEASVEAKLSEIDKVEAENEKLKEKVNTLESVINKNGK